MSQLELAIQTGKVWDDSLEKLADMASAVDPKNFGNYTDYLIASAKAAARINFLADAVEARAVIAPVTPAPRVPPQGAGGTVRNWDDWVNRIFSGGLLGKLFDGVPGFANGGNHSGGLRVVGENGPELEYTPPSRIISNHDLGRAISGGGTTELVEEVRALRVEVAALREEAAKTARNTRDAKDKMSRWERVGLLTKTEG